MNAKPIPEGFSTLTPFITVRGGREAIEFYKKALGATLVGKPLLTPDGRVAYAALKVAGATLMLADEMKEMAACKSPIALGGTTIALSLYVDDVDAWAKKAIDAGAKVVEPVKDQFYGDRSGTIADPFGHVWWLGTHIEDVSHEEMERRAKELFSAKK